MLGHGIDKDLGRVQKVQDFIMDCPAGTEDRGVVDWFWFWPGSRMAREADLLSGMSDKCSIRLCINGVGGES